MAQNKPMPISKTDNIYRIINTDRAGCLWGRGMRVEALGANGREKLAAGSKPVDRGPSRGPSRGPFRGPLYFAVFSPVDCKFLKENI